jgi:sarcosine oxidase delta subunit
MKSTSHCVICNTGSTTVFKAAMSGFVWERMSGKVMLDGVIAAGIWCEHCSFVQSEWRFSPEEETRYYHEYMQDKPSDPTNSRQHGDYVFHRLRNEGPDWYSWVHLYQSPEYIGMRKSIMNQCFDAYGVKLSTIKTVLDYGGDKGQYIPDEVATKYVLEVENRTPVTGVTAIASVTDIEPVDLVMCCHTLEHVSYPMDLVRDMKRYIKPGGLIYIEVPDEVDNLTNNPDTFKFHEHINLFTADSLQKILIMEGFEPSINYKLEYKSTEQTLELAQSIIGRLL